MARKDHKTCRLRCTNDQCSAPGTPVTFTKRDVADAGGAINCERCDQPMQELQK